jgi:type II secretion system protein I
MSRTGNKGFTLIEVMISVAILAFGVILVYEALFKSLDAFGYYSNYFAVACWMDEKIWQAQDALKNTGAFSEESQGVYTSNGREFPWNLSVLSLDSSAGLYRIDLRVGGQPGSRRPAFTRSAYALFAKK